MQRAQADRPVDDPLRVVVVDDELLAREDLVQMLVGRRGISVIATCATGGEAVRAVQRFRPDLLLLDIRMPGLDGFGVVAQLDAELMPYVVFVTAFDRFALEAFRVRALDYLLKPVQPARLDQALSRAREQLRMRAVVAWAAALKSAAREQSPAVASRPGASGYWSEIMVRAGLRDIVLRVDEIDWVEADTYYARLHVRGRSFLLRERMHVLEASLDPGHFARVHRSAIVNLNRVREIAHDGHGEHVVVLSSGARVRTSHQRWLEFRAIMRERARPGTGPRSPESR
jgi:two-component system LytT family response regulator